MNPYPYLFIELDGKQVQTLIIMNTPCYTSLN